MSSAAQLMADIYEGTPSFDARAYHAAGHRVIAIKASEGQTEKDSKHDERCDEAHAAGLSVVHYHFGRPDDGNTPEQEGENFIRSMGHRLRKGDWVALDFERFTGRGAVADVEWINAFWVYVHNHLGREGLPDRTWLYASRSYLQEFIATGKLIIHRLWDADWSTGPSIKTGKFSTICRQQSGDGYGPGPHSLPGIGGDKIDVDLLDKSVVPR